MSSALFLVNPALAIKYFLTFSMFSHTIIAMGTARHYQYVEATEEGTVSVQTACNLVRQAHRMVVFSIVLVWNDSYQALDLVNNVTYNKEIALLNFSCLHKYIIFIH
jgi:hypothetical protein